MTSYQTVSDVNDYSVIVNNNEHCSICHNTLDKDIVKDVVKGKLCSHKFHKKCILDWLKRNGTCPVCRTAIVNRQTNVAILVTFALIVFTLCMVITAGVMFPFPNKEVSNDYQLGSSNVILILVTYLAYLYGDYLYLIPLAFYVTCEVLCVVLFSINMGKFIVSFDELNIAHKIMLVFYHVLVYLPVLGGIVCIVYLLFRICRDAMEKINNVNNLVDV